MTPIAAPIVYPSAPPPRPGNEKGRVERPIGLVRDRFWPAGKPTDLLHLDVKATPWRDTFANTRVHASAMPIRVTLESHFTVGAGDAQRFCVNHPLRTTFV